MMDEIEAAVEASRSILALPDNWDGEGAPGYAPETWERAVKFIRDTAEAFGKPVPAPRISNGPWGSIDILWRSGGREVLINFPADATAQPDFYGDNGEQRTETVKGVFRVEVAQPWLLAWLTAEN